MALPPWGEWHTCSFLTQVHACNHGATMQRDTYFLIPVTLTKGYLFSAVIFAHFWNSNALHSLPLNLLCTSSSRLCSLSAGVFDPYIFCECRPCETQVHSRGRIYAHTYYTSYRIPIAMYLLLWPCYYYCTYKEKCTGSILMSSSLALIFSHQYTVSYFH